jgi:DNA-directed RNA polymerase specialized sigma24 family protein
LRQIIVLRDILQLSVAETASVLGITPANVKVRLLRARLAMRDALASYCQHGAAVRRVTQRDNSETPALAGL